jgi:hypothetical protein
MALRAPNITSPEDQSGDDAHWWRRRPALCHAELLDVASAPDIRAAYLPMRRAPWIADTRS